MLKYKYLNKKGESYENVKIRNMLIAGGMVVMINGCAQPGPEATKGALVGGAGAAGVTALVGGSARSVATAAAVGAVLGGVYGDSKDKASQQNLINTPMYLVFIYNEIKRKII